MLSLEGISNYGNISMVVDMLGSRPTTTSFSYAYFGAKNRGDKKNDKQKTENTETQDILMWKPQIRKNHMESTNPKTNHYDERSTTRNSNTTTLYSPSSHKRRLSYYSHTLSLTHSLFVTKATTLFNYTTIINYFHFITTCSKCI